ncbi:homoserine kinase [Neptunicella marina]|uniref:Homoserine kinase n=1 Tax=Neptunicella marina TaxID=2125989 RepID=A0A8J6IXJ6_9ALTE|nr:homoserine kinase [Neptunicella marina]
MSKQSIIKAYAPASIGNVSLGFDILGAALQPIDGSPLGDEVFIQEANEFSLSVSGKFAHKLPGEAKDNIVAHAYAYFNQQLKAQNREIKVAKMHLIKHLPIGSGLGSSASSIVAAFAALNAFYDNPFNQHQLLLMMGELEGQISGSIHYDNVAPCYLGGMTLMIETEQQIATQLPVFDDWYWVSCYSGLSVSTSAARKILPGDVSLSTAITFGKQLGVFVHALHQGDRQLAASMIQDVIAEPYRKSLLPDYDNCKKFALENGALAFGISGSGPTVFAVCNQLQQAQQIEQFLGSHYVKNDTGFSHICRIDTNGAQCVEGTEFGII